MLLRFTSFILCVLIITTSPSLDDVSLSRFVVVVVDSLARSLIDRSSRKRSSSCCGNTPRHEKGNYYLVERKSCW